MIPLKTFLSERRAANLLAQVRWRDGVYCPRCRTESRIRHGSYRVFQRYRCKNYDRTFNDQTGTVFEHSAVELRKWFLAVYTYIRFNTSLRQLDVEINVSYKRCTGASSARRKRWTRLAHNSKGQLRSTTVRESWAQRPRARRSVALAWALHAWARIVPTGQATRVHSG